MFFFFFKFSRRLKIKGLKEKIVYEVKKLLGIVKSIGDRVLWYE